MPGQYNVKLKNQLLPPPVLYSPTLTVRSVDAASSIEHQYTPSGGVPVVLFSLTTIKPLVLVTPGTSIRFILVPSGPYQFPVLGVPGRLVLQSRAVLSVEPISLIAT